MNSSIYIPENVRQARQRRKAFIAVLIILWLLAAGLAIWLGLIIFRPMLEDRFKGETTQEIEYYREDVITLYSLTSIEDFSASEAEEQLAMDLPEEERWFREEVVAMYHCNDSGEVRAVPTAQKTEFEKDGYREYECVYVENDLGEGKIIDVIDLDNYESEGYKRAVWNAGKSM